MEVRSLYKYARLSTLKGRDVARVIQGLPASQALDILAYTPRKAARLIEKTLRSAIANAENNHNLDADSLFVRQAVVTTGPSLKRFKPRAKGGAAPIRKPTSHIQIVVSDEAPVVKERKSRRHLSPEKAAAAANGKSAAKSAKASKPAKATKSAAETATAEASAATNGAASAEA